MSLITLVYSSTATAPLDEEALIGLLTQARDNNTRLHVTGLLLYRDATFMQLLEGEEKTILALEQRIKGDLRHTNVKRLLMHPIAGRQFPAWAMGFRDAEMLRRRFAESDFLSRPLDSVAFAEAPTEAQRLLLAFREG